MLNFLYKNLGPLVVLALVLISVTGQLAAQPQYGLEPKEQPFLESGKFTAAEGATDEEGIRFVLNDNKFDQPVVLSVVAKDPSKPITVKMASETWDQIHREVVTDEQGGYTGSFRGEGLMAFWLTGPEGAEYELAVWVGPPQEFAPRSTLVSMDEFEDGDAADASATVEVPEASGDGSRADDSAGQSSTTGSGSESDVPVWAFASAGISLVSLLAMTAMFLQMRNSRSASNMIALGLCLTLSGAQVARAETDKTPSTLKPGQMKRALDTLIEGAKAVAGGGHTKSESNSASGAASNDLILRDPDRGTTGELTGNRVRQERLDQRNRTRRRANNFRNTRDSVRSSLANGMAALTMAGSAAEFFFPSEAPLAPDYLPADLPKLPTRGYGDLDSETLGRFQASERHLIAVVQRMEQNRYHFNVLMAKVGAFHDFAGAAGGMNPIAGIYVAKLKNDPWLLQQTAETKAKYDDAFQSLITQANESLLEMSVIEREAFGDQDWYNRYGLPFYTYMNNRYTRRS